MDDHVRFIVFINASLFITYHPVAFFTLKRGLGNPAS
jgi:hypothetical protein